MPQSGNDKTLLDKAGEALFDFAIDRKDVKALVAHLPPEVKCNPTAVEYELQLLKIISTGWALSYFMENNPLGEKLAVTFWELIHKFSADLSETTGLMAGHDIDYFQILRKRLDTYVTRMHKKPEMQEPAAVIGPEFARFCGDADDVFTVMTGSRMFSMTVSRVKDYLDSLEFQ